MKKSILFLSFLILIQANPLCAMQRKEQRVSGHRTFVLRAVSPVLTLALLLALVKPAEGCWDPFGDTCERLAEEKRQTPTPPILVHLAAKLMDKL